jgi:5-methylcytosine-specific restriction endonuclease McrBC regulatory subunit McrC
MIKLDNHPIRICEWANRPVDELTTAQRVEIDAAVTEWCREAGITDSPLQFQGPGGTTMAASHYVGVVEAAGVCIEIFPKLDKTLLGKDAQPSDGQSGTVMSNLLWMMASCRFMELAEADAAHLSTSTVTYYDVFAYLMAKNLRSELEAGISHFYVPSEGDLHAVRGRLNISEQITRNWNRMDRVSCRWDEFTADIPLNRLFKCACRVLQTRVSNPAAIQVLDDCCGLLDEVTDVEPRVALTEVGTARWHRATDRFRDCFDMAVRLLSGTGYEMGMGADKSFVFLIDMNRLFEAYAAAVLEARFDVQILEQENIGTLFTRPALVQQKPDFLWVANGMRWIGDAKYKMLSGDDRALELPKFNDLSPADVRQLTVYAEMTREKTDGVAPSLALLYPFVGDRLPDSSPGIAWNGSQFWIVPVRVTRPLNSLSNLDSACQIKFDIDSVIS